MILKVFLVFGNVVFEPKVIMVDLEFLRLCFTIN